MIIVINSRMSAWCSLLRVCWAKTWPSQNVKLLKVVKIRFCLFEQREKTFFLPKTRRKNFLTSWKNLVEFVSIRNRWNFHRSEEEKRRFERTWKRRQISTKNSLFAERRTVGEALNEFPSSSIARNLDSCPNRKSLTVEKRRKVNFRIFVKFLDKTKSFRRWSKNVDAPDLRKRKWKIQFRKAKWKTSRRFTWRIGLDKLLHIFQLIDVRLNEADLNKTIFPNFRRTKLFSHQTMENRRTNRRKIR